MHVRNKKRNHGVGIIEKIVVQRHASIVKAHGFVPSYLDAGDQVELSKCPKAIRNKSHVTNIEFKSKFVRHGISTFCRF